MWTVENPEANEFYTVELIGGGAGGTTNARGGAGESKAVYYPSLRGTYKIVLGAGGEAENNGKPTIFYITNLPISGASTRRQSFS